MHSTARRRGKRAVHDPIKHPGKKGVEAADHGGAYTYTATSSGSGDGSSSSSEGGSSSGEDGSSYYTYSATTETAETTATTESEYCRGRRSSGGSRRGGKRTGSSRRTGARDEWSVDYADAAPLVVDAGVIDLSSLGLTAVPASLLSVAAASTDSEPSVADSVTELHLSSNSLSSVPSRLFKFPQLETLSLQYNRLSRVPREIGRLNSLQYLYLYRNELTELPESIGQLGNLKWLDLRCNALTRLPAAIGKLTSLHGLYLFSNQLTTLPPELGNLTSLRLLDLSHNPLRPDVMAVYADRAGARDVPDLIGFLSYVAALGKEQSSDWSVQQLMARGTSMGVAEGSAGRSLDSYVADCVGVGSGLRPGQVRRLAHVVVDDESGPAAGRASDRGTCGDDGETGSSPQHSAVQGNVVDEGEAVDVAASASDAARLPPAILAAVFGHLSPPEVAAAAAVCTAWRRAAEEAEDALWSDAAVVCRRGVDDTAVSALVRSHPAISRLDLGGSWLVGATGLASVATCLGPSLRELNMRNVWRVSDSEVAHIVRCAPQLTRLVLDGCDRLTDAALVSLSSASALSYLSMFGCYSFRARSIAEFLRPHGGLEQVRLSGSPSFTDDNVATITAGRSGALIVGLDLGQCSAITDATVARVISHCPNIETLDLSSTQASAIHCMGLSTSCQKLHTLSFRGCVNLRCAGLDDLVFYCSDSLTRLDVSGCPGITREAVASLNEEYAGTTAVIFSADDV